MNADIRKKLCTVELGILPGTRCDRAAVLEITNHGRHVGWRCAFHADDYIAADGKLYASVHYRHNMIPGLSRGTGRDVSCWMTDETAPHPPTGCPSSDGKLKIATDGRDRWVSCDKCKRTWFLQRST